MYPHIFETTLRLPCQYLSLWVSLDIQSLSRFSQTTTVPRSMVDWHPWIGTLRHPLRLPEPKLPLAFLIHTSLFKFAPLLGINLILAPVALFLLPRDTAGAPDPILSAQSFNQPSELHALHSSTTKVSLDMGSISPTRVSLFGPS